MPSPVSKILQKTLKSRAIRKKLLAGTLSATMLTTAAPQKALAWHDQAHRAIVEAAGVPRGVSKLAVKADQFRDFSHFINFTEDKSTWSGAFNSYISSPGTPVMTSTRKALHSKSGLASRKAITDSAIHRDGPQDIARKISREPANFQHLIGDASMPLHAMEYNDFNKKHHRSWDAFFENVLDPTKDSFNPEIIRDLKNVPAATGKIVKNLENLFYETADYALDAKNMGISEMSMDRVLPLLKKSVAISKQHYEKYGILPRNVGTFIEPAVQEKQLRKITNAATTLTGKGYIDHAEGGKSGQNFKEYLNQYSERLFSTGLEGMSSDNLKYYMGKLASPQKQVLSDILGVSSKDLLKMSNEELVSATRKSHIFGKAFEAYRWDIPPVGKPYNKIIGHHPGRMQKVTENTIQSDFSAGSSVNKLRLTKKAFYTFNRIAGGKAKARVVGTSMTPGHAKKVIAHLSQSAPIEDIESLKSYIPRIMRLASGKDTFEVYNAGAFKHFLETRGAEYATMRAAENIRHERMHRIFTKYLSEKSLGETGSRRKWMESILKDAYGTSDIKKIPLMGIAENITGAGYGPEKYAEEFLVRALSRENFTPALKKGVKPIVDVLSKDSFFKPIFTEGKTKYAISPRKMSKALGETMQGNINKRATDLAYSKSLTQAELSQWGSGMHTADLVGTLDKNKVNHQIMNVKKKTAHLF